MDWHDEASNDLTVPVYRGKADVNVSPHGVAPLVVHWPFQQREKSWRAVSGIPISNALFLTV
jgi:hypothetical protein